MIALPSFDGERKTYRSVLSAAGSSERSGASRWLEAPAGDTLSTAASAADAQLVIVFIVILQAISLFFLLGILLDGYVLVFFNGNSVEKSLKRAVLAPNSSNLQLWAFYRVQSKLVRTELANACMGQSAAKTASELVVFVARLSNWQTHAKWNAQNMENSLSGKELTKKDKRGLEYYTKIIPFFYKNDFFSFHTLFRKIMIGFNGLSKPIMRLTTKTDQRIIAHKSVALAAQTFMLSMTAEGFDTCPMEGFDKYLVKNILKLRPTDEITMIIACGKAKPEGIYYQRTRLPLNQVVFNV